MLCNNKWHLQRTKVSTPWTSVDSNQRIRINTHKEKKKEKEHIHKNKGKGKDNLWKKTMQIHKEKSYTQI